MFFLLLSAALTQFKKINVQIKDLTKFNKIKNAVLLH